MSKLVNVGKRKVSVDNRVVDAVHGLSLVEHRLFYLFLGNVILDLLSIL
jgi:hypothetical protein